MACRTKRRRSRGANRHFLAPSPPRLVQVPLVRLPTLSFHVPLHFRPLLPLPVSLPFEGREALEALQDFLLRAGLGLRAMVPTCAVADLAHPFRTWAPRFPAATPGARVSTHSPREARPDASRVPCRDHFRSRIPARHSPPRASPGDSVSTHGGSAPRPAVLWSNGPPEDRSSPQRRVFALPR